MRVKDIAWGLALYVTAIAAMYKYPVYEGTGSGTSFDETGRHRGFMSAKGFSKDDG